MKDYDRFISMVDHVRDQLNSIEEYGHSLKVGDAHAACNLLGVALVRLEDVSGLITEAYGL